MKRFIFLLSAGLLLFLTSCSSYRYQATRIESLDFTQYKTYGWLPGIDSLSKGYFKNDIAKSNIITSTNNELERRGLTYSKENPDILFRYVTIVNNKSRIVYATSHLGMGWGWGWHRPWGFHGGYSYPMGRERIRYAHVILEALDRKSNSVVWQARASGEINSPEAAINKLPKLISGIMKEYPVQIQK